MLCSVIQCFIHLLSSIPLQLHLIVIRWSLMVFLSMNNKVPPLMISHSSLLTQACWTCCSWFRGCHQNQAFFYHLVSARQIHKLRPVSLCRSVSGCHLCGSGCSWDFSSQWVGHSCSNLFTAFLGNLASLPYLTLGYCKLEYVFAVVHFNWSGMKCIHWTYLLKFINSFRTETEAELTVYL